MKKGLLVASLVVGLLALGACGNGKEETAESTQSDDKKVVIGMDDTFVPMGFKDKDGKIVGFDVDLAKAVFKLADKEVEFQPIDWSMKETELDNDTIDLIWNGYSKTAEREKKVAFSDPYMVNDQVLVTPKDKNITEFSEMKGKILGAQEGSSGYDLFTKQPEKLKDIVKDQDAVLYANFSEAFIDLQNGRIDGLLIDHVYANYYLNQEKKLDDFNIVKGDFNEEDYAVGARKSDKALLEEINNGFKELKENGEFKKISEKWFGTDVSVN